MNGQFAGYSEESHNTAEFDITDKVHEGRNELVCVVRRWCNGTYLECQDMFRNNGIFRDVLLRISDKNDFWDIDIKTRKLAYIEDGREVSFTIKGTDHDGNPMCHTLKAISKEGEAKVTFTELEVLQWSAENPVLYDLYIESPYSCIHQRVGFKSIDIRGNLYLLNGHKIKFKGVNHHDTDPKNGYCMTPSEIERDLRLCKQFNIDTVRTSHYAPDPLLIELAAELGIYIVDEVDIETGGHRDPRGACRKASAHLQQTVQRQDVEEPLPEQNGPPLPERQGACHSDHHVEPGQRERRRMQHQCHL